MPKTVEFIFDFVSPNAYLAWYPLMDVLDRQGAELSLTPAFLGGIMKLTGNNPPLVRDANIKGKNAYFMLEMQRFIDKHGFTRFQMNPHFPMNTLTVLRMLVHMQQEGRAKLFVEHMLPEVWERGVNVADGEELAASLERGGFDVDALLAAAQQREIKKALIDNTERAVERGVFGVPTFFVGDEMYFGKDRLDGVEEELAR